jgi:hypothetical protein
MTAHTAAASILDFIEFLPVSAFSRAAFLRDNFGSPDAPTQVKHCKESGDGD